MGALFEQVLEKNPDTVKIVYKHFPLNSHRYAAQAALASYAAQQQGKFWQYHDLLFENFNKLTNSSFDEFARKLNLNMPMFNRVMNSPEAKEKVTKDFLNGRDAGVQGTPSLFINGRRVRNRDAESIQKIIDEILDAPLK